MAWKANGLEKERKSERQRETDRQRERDRDRYRERENTVRYIFVTNEWVCEAQNTNEHTNNEGSSFSEEGEDAQKPFSSAEAKIVRLETAERVR